MKVEHSLYDVDKEARFQKVYDAYMQDVYRLCFSYMKNKMDTEDAVQETFCRFYQAMERVKEKEHVKEIEKLEKLGFNLPFIVKLSHNLMLYDLLDKVYFDSGEVMDKLWP